MARKKRLTKLVEVTHKCGHVLGSFISEDDHGGITAVCPKCRKEVYLANQVISNVVGDEEEWADSLTDSECRVVEVML